MKTTINNIKTKNVASVYLDKNDPKFISIKDRAVTDLKQSIKRADPESPENKLIAAQIKTWTSEKQNKLPVLFEKSIKEYTAQTQFDAETFLLVFDELGKKDQKKIAEEYDIRVQYLGDDKYVAEFWEDGLAVNSEANAVAYAHELANSEYAKKHPDGDVGNVEVVKKNYANTRKSIKDGKQERYTKMMALLYTIEKDGSVTFHDPGQPIIDFVKNNSK
ncbi:MAG: hypothetical protein NTZ27_12570 [Ignavibacteriales bacterium]|nr:hypothetical protein [Ignavibacteriales bacterium]